MTEVEVRLATVEDLPFVFSCWLRSYRHSSQFAKKISNATYYKWHHAIIEHLIGTAGTQVRIIHPTGDTGTILGFSCISMYDNKPVVHFVYIKKAFREMGLAKKLIWETGPGYFSHMTENLKLDRHPDFEYNPYLI